MNVSIKKIFAVVWVSMLAVSCIKDKGNYDHQDGQKVSIEFPGLGPDNSLFAFIGEQCSIDPALAFKEGDAAAFEYEWFINGVLASRERKFDSIPGKVGIWVMSLNVKDKKTGYNNQSGIFRVLVSSPYDKGFAILYDDNGKSVLGHIRLNGNGYINYDKVYETMNNGELLGSGPVHIQEYEVGDNGRGLFVLQQGGQGSVELDGYNYKKQLTVKAAFKNNVPAGFSPKSLAMLRTADYILNEDGKLYNRFFSNPIPFSTPWNANPVAGDMKIAAIWDTWSSVTGSSMLFDKQHNRLLEIQTDNSGAFITDMPDASPWTPYPTDFPPLNNMGAHEYIWGGTMQDQTGYRKGIVLLKDPVDHKIYFHTFAYFSGFFTSLEPEKRMLFPGGDVLTANSKFYAVKDRGYLLFTGGPNNDQLYYFDVETGLPHKLYVQTESPITDIAANMNVFQSATIAVGLQNGTTILYEFSNETILTGQSKELHRFTHTGRVIDIATRGNW